MKKLGISALLLLISVAAVKPQAYAEGVRVRVPYDFVVSGRLMNAGTYTIERLSSASSTNVLLIRNSDPKGPSTFALFTTFDPFVTDQANVKFRQMSDLHVLSAIQTQDGVYTVAASSRKATMASTDGSGMAGGK